VNGSWRLVVAALNCVARGSIPPRAALRLVPLAGIVLGLGGACVYWLGAQLWPTSVALMLAMLATVSIAPPEAATGNGVIYRVFFLIIKYNALMALSSAKLPFSLPEHLTLGLVMVAGQAASRALVVSVMSSSGPAAIGMTAADLAVAMIVGLAPAALLGIPGLIGLAAAIAVRLARTSSVLPGNALPCAERLDVTQQLTEIGFYLGALATWRFV